MGDISKAFLAIIGGAFSLALVSVLVSRNAATSDVLRSAGSSLSGVIGAATAPVTNNKPGGGGNLASGGLMAGANADALLNSFGMPSFFSNFLR